MRILSVKRQALTLEYPSIYSMFYYKYPNKIPRALAQRRNGVPKTKYGRNTNRPRVSDSFIM